MSQRKRNPGAIRDLESIINPLTGDITTTGAITAASITVSGAGTFGSLLVTGAAVVNGSLTVSGGITTNTLTVTGSSILASLLVTGNATINGSLTVSGGITTNTLAVTGAASLGSLTVTGNTALNGDVTVSGTLTVEDSITMAGTQIRHPVQFGPFTLTASTVSLVTDLPNWQNEISMTVINLSLNGTSIPILQFWTGTGLVTSGYLGAIIRAVDASATVGENHTNGFRLAPSTASGMLLNGRIHLQRHGTATSNTWGYAFTAGRSDSQITVQGGGHIALPGPLTKLSVNTATGTQVYDNGEIAGFYRY